MGEGGNAGNAGHVLMRGTQVVRHYGGRSFTVYLDEHDANSAAARINADERREQGLQAVGVRPCEVRYG